jgi:hypothetical protein
MCGDLRKRKGTLIFGQALVTIWLPGFNSSPRLNAQVRQQKESGLPTRLRDMLRTVSTGVKVCSR